MSLQSLQTALSTGDAYPSPPIGDYDPQSQKENNECTEEDGVRDPQLFKASDVAASIAPDEPLFPPGETSDPTVENAIAVHMNSPEVASLAIKPTKEEYLLAVNFFPEVVAQARLDPRAWFRQEREFANRYRAAGGYRIAKTTPSKPLRRLAPALPSASRKQKTQLPRLPRAAPKPKRTPQSRVYDSFVHGTSPSPKPAKAPTNRDDTNYNALPDIPPPNTIPPGSKLLHTDWKGAKLDLSNDPDRHMLLENEIAVAATLRLSCATYLCSKRRIFQARIEALRIGKEFRKTDAQQACKIDVNKASKLWIAYDKVNWFDKEHFMQFL